MRGSRWTGAVVAVAAVVIASSVGASPPVAAAPAPERTPAAGASAAGASGSVLTPRLQELGARAQSGTLAPSTAGQSADVFLPASGPGSLSRADDGRLLVQLRVADTSAATVGALAARGATVTEVVAEYHMITVAIDPSLLGGLADVDAVRSASEVLAPMVWGSGVDTTGGPVAAECAPIVSEGDVQLSAADARSSFGVDGTGVTVGLLSDSFDSDAAAATTAADDVASGDLPGPDNPCGRTTPVSVLSETANGTDEGRAMAQIVHDLAPGAQLMFSAGGPTDTAFAQHVTDLRNAGADVLVDDVTYFSEPWFQDGPIANAVNAAKAAGVSYFSSAGNSAGISGGNNWNGYEAPAYRPTPCPAAVTGMLDCHNFSTSGTDATYGFTLADGFTIRPVLQWKEPWNGVVTNLDSCLLRDAELVGCASTDNLTTQKPYEAFGYTADGDEDLALVIGRRSGTAVPRLKTVFFRTAGIGSVEYGAPGGADTAGRQIVGHNGTSGVVSVAATAYNDGTHPRSFSSYGPVTHYFGPVSGATPAAPLAVPNVLAKPDITATDGVQNTFFGPGSPHRFSGTSAAAPHAAAIAALMLERNPSDLPSGVAAQMRATATAMSGAPSVVGAGRVDAYGAVGVALDGPTIVSFTPSEGPVGTRVTITGANLADATAVTFDGVAATDFTVESSTEITATVPDGATTGPIEITTPDGAATSADGFTVIREAVRIWGQDELDTSVAISQAGFPDDGSASAVVLARSDFFADALAGGPLAAEVDGPLLLTHGAPTAEGDTLPPEVLTEIDRLLDPGQTVYVLGGALAISPGVEAELEDAGYAVVRVWGANQFATAVAIADEIGAPSAILEATGWNFPDALSAVPAAIGIHGVILLTNDNVQAPETQAFIAAHPGATRYTIGGNLVAGGADPGAINVSGPDLFGTSAAVASRWFPGPAQVGIATGANFPDALSGGVFMATGGRRGPMLLVHGTALPVPSSIATYLGALDPGTTAYAFGGPLAIVPGVLDAVVAALGT